MTEAPAETPPDPPDPEAEAFARRLMRRAVAWGVLTLFFLWWFSRHWAV